MSTRYRLSVSGFDTGAMAHDFSGVNSDIQGVGNGDGWTDALAVAVATALKSVAWPANMSWSISKIDTTVTETDLNAATNPPSWP